MSPPTEEAGPVGPATSPLNTTTGHHSSGFLQSNAAGRHCRVVQSHRRRMASQRLPLLVCGHRDPWTPWRPEHVSVKQAEGAAQAAEHLLGVGLVPMFDPAVLEAMRRIAGRWAA
jgi:hypothetical protein